MSFLSKVFRYENENGESITFTYENGFLINKPAGIDTVSVNLTQTAGINQVGATIQSTNVQPRPVNIAGKLVGGFQTTNKGKLLSVIRPDLKAKLYADDYYLNVVPTATPTIEPKERFAGFSFSVLAAYPYWLNDENATSVLQNMEKCFRFPLVNGFVPPYRFARKVEAELFNIENRGQLPVPFTLTFYANVETINPKITNINTRKYLLLNKQLTAGEKVVVEITHGRTYVTSSVDGDIRGALSLKSSLNRLDVGENVLKPEAESGGDDLEVSIQFATEVVGISL